MSSPYEDLCSHLNADELGQWNLICFCIEKNYDREISLRVNPLRTDALCADLEHRFDLAALLRDIAQQVSSVLESKKNETLATEFHGFLATLRDLERVETIQRLQDEILRSTCQADPPEGA